ncbi:MAG: glycosyltransferase involved in cell wall biosynthesis [Pirellulaceae bacterium]|jgi:glycosyltransferase involved in cell wall biosynthesis
MKLLQVFNQYRTLFNGEATVVDRVTDLVEANGGECRVMSRSSVGIDHSVLKKFSAFWNGLYSRKSYVEMKNVIAEYQPDIVHAHNLYPLFSPSVLVAAREENIPVVLTVHNHGLTCPRSDHLNKGKICEKCVGGKEYNCVLQNCRENILESVAYAARATIARKFKLFTDNVTTVIALSTFARERFQNYGFRDDQISVLPNLFASPVDDNLDLAVERSFVGFAGRLSPEKGTSCLARASHLIPEIPIRLAGDGVEKTKLESQVGSNVTFLGRCNQDEMNSFYRQARFIVVPSLCFEMCPLVIVEAMSHGIPVIASRIGGLSEIVRDGETGLLFEPDNEAELARRIRQLWNDGDLYKQLSVNAREFASGELGDDVYYQKLIQIYEAAARKHGKTLPRDKQIPAGVTY